MKFNENYIANVPSLKYNYLIKVVDRNMEFQISANHEQDALDYVVNYISIEYPDVIMTLDQEDEMRAQGILEEYASGGDNRKYLATKNVIIKKTLNKGVKR